MKKFFLFFVPIVFIAGRIFCEDAYEPNDNFNQAYGPLNYGQTYTSYISSPTDVDYYKIEISTPIAIIVKCTYSNWDLIKLSYYNFQYSSNDRIVNSSIFDNYSYDYPVINDDDTVIYIKVFTYTNTYSNEPYSINVTSIVPGMITGTVTDNENNPLNNVYIYAYGKMHRSTRTNSDGNYIIKGLMEGIYNISCEVSENLNFVNTKKMM